jgi:hypothetical protein
MVATKRGSPEERHDIYAREISNDSPYRNRPGSAVPRPNLSIEGSLTGIGSVVSDGISDAETVQGIILTNSIGSNQQPIDLVNPFHQQILDKLVLLERASKDDTLKMAELAKSVVDLQAEKIDGSNLPIDKSTDGSNTAGNVL